jgi:type I restriction enzyme, S subunit
MKAGWVTKPLGAVCAFDKVQGIHAGLPYVGLENIESHTARFIGSPDDQSVKSSTFRFSSCHVLYGRLRPYLNKALAPDFDGHCSTEIFPLRPSADLLREYLLYWLLSDQTCDRINATCTGARMPRAQMDEVLSFDFPLPPLSDQRRIIALLDEAFEGIAIAKANAERSLQNALALFESHLHSVFTYRGTGWVETTLGAVCELVGGSQPPKSVFEQQQTNDNVRLIQIRDYKSDKHIVFIPRKLAKRFCDADDVMIGRYGPPLFQILRGIEGAYNVALMKAVPDLSKLSSNFLFYFLKHSDILQHVIHHSDRAAGQIGITKETLEPYPIALPSHEVQERVVSTIMELETETQRLEAIYIQKLAALEDLKKSLLHQAFTGQL